MEQSSAQSSSVGREGHWGGSSFFEEGRAEGGYPVEGLELAGLGRRRGLTRPGIVFFGRGRAAAGGRPWEGERGKEAGRKV